MQTSLDLIANKAKKKKHYRFCNLYTMLNQENLKDSFKLLNKRSAVGVDRVSVKQYGKHLDANVENLIERLKRKRYRAKLVKRELIPKSNGKLRPLGMPVTEDKLLQKTASRILEAVFDVDFINSSYGYRRNVGPQDAVRKLKSKLQFGTFGYVVEVDIKGFFDHINHDLLLALLKQRINDRPFLGLIRKWLKAGVLEKDGKVIHPDTGTPQGGVVSPVLANVYLHYAIDLWFKKVVWKQIEGQAYIIRYADDFVCLFQYWEDASRFYKALPRRLGKFGLEVAPDKTRIIKFTRYQKDKSGKFSFLGFEFKWGVNRSGTDQLQVQTCRKKLNRILKDLALWCKENRHKGIKKIMRMFNSKLRGHYNYYGIIGNIIRLGNFYHRTKCALKRWLNRRSQKRSFSLLQASQLMVRF
jgi:group II intron reverse transcriptase/maturase